MSDLSATRVSLQRMSNDLEGVDDQELERPLLSDQGDRGQALLPPTEGPKVGKVTVLGAFFNLATVLEGNGLLALPYAVSVGSFGALVCVGIVAVIACFTLVTIARCMYDNDGKRVRSSYAEVGRACFGQTGERIVVFIQSVNLLCVGVTFLVLLASSMHAVVPQLSQRVWTAIVCGVLMPLIHLKEFHHLSYLSAVGVLCLLALVVIVMVFSCMHIASEGFQKYPPVTATSVPASFSMLVFAFSCHSLAPDLEASMARPEKFPLVAISVFSVNCMLKIFFMVVGFLAFGENVAQVVTNDLPTAPRVACSVLIVVSKSLSFPIILLAVVNRFDQFRASQGAAAPGRWFVFLQRTTVLFIQGGIAIAIPQFALAMAFIGSVTLPFMNFLFPCLFYAKLRWHSLKYRIVLIPFGLVALIGILGGVTGFASTLHLLTTTPAPKH